MVTTAQTTNSLPAADRFLTAADPYAGEGCPPSPPVLPTQTTGLVQQFVESTGQLYSLPAAAAEVLRLAGEPTIDLKAIKQCVESDPALAARILRVTNSSLFGPGRHVTDLNQALTLLGIRPLKILVLGFSLPKELFAGLEADVLSWYWRHTLVKAVAARELAEHIWRMPGDEPFLAGLVQDIGVLALVQQLGRPYQELLNHTQTHGVSLLAGELETLGFDHLVLSARLLNHWGLPPGLCAAVSVPPDAARIGELSRDERTLPQMLHLAELLARLIEQPYGSALHELLKAGSVYCGLTYDQLQTLVAALQDKVRDLAEALSLELPGGQTYVDLLLAAQAQLANETLLAVASAGKDDIGRLASELQRELASAARPLAKGKPSMRAATRASSFERPRTVASAVTLAADGRAPTTLPSAKKEADLDLLSRITRTLETARQKRAPLALALVEVDRYTDVVMQLGAAGAREAVHLLEDAISEWAGAGTQVVLVSDNRVALILCDGSRRDAVQLARQILSAVKSWSREQLPLGFELTLSIGLSALEVPPRNYPAGDMLVSAERCLVAAILSGGNTVKSIDL